MLILPEELPLQSILLTTVREESFVISDGCTRLTVSYCMQLFASVIITLY